MSYATESYQSKKIKELQDALKELIRVIELMDPPDYGYIYDDKEAECCGCQHKASTREAIQHDPDCFQLAMQKAKDAIK